MLAAGSCVGKGSPQQQCVGTSGVSLTGAMVIGHHKQVYCFAAMVKTGTELNLKSAACGWRLPGVTLTDRHKIRQGNSLLGIVSQATVLAATG